MKYNLGDVVRLQSGGPPMTINKMHQTNLTCLWFDGTKLKESEFHCDMITLSATEDAQDAV